MSKSLLIIIISARVGRAFDLIGQVTCSCEEESAKSELSKIRREMNFHFILCTATGNQLLLTSEPSYAAGMAATYDLKETSLDMLAPKRFFRFKGKRMWRNRIKKVKLITILLLY